MQPITAYLWFDDQAQDAVNLYVSAFADSKMMKAMYPMQRIDLAALRLARDRV